MKIQIEFTEQIWTRMPFTLEIPDEELAEYAPDLDLENEEACQLELEDYILSNYSFQDLIAMGADTDGNTEVTITEINK